MSWEGWATLSILGIVFWLLTWTRTGPDVIMLGGLTLLVTLGIVTPSEALAGLANEGMVTVGVLFVVAVGLRETGGMHVLLQRLLGMSIRDGHFRNLYNAVVIAVARNGERVRKKIGDIILRSGDTLLLETRPSFVDQQRNSRDFYLVSQVEDSTPLRHERVWIALTILIGMVVSVTLSWLSMLNAAMLAAGLLILTGCCTASMARRSVDWQVLLVIAAAFGMERALHKSGAAAAVAHTMLALAGENPWVALATVYGVTMFFSNMITNNAAAVLMFPIALATASSLGVNLMPFVIAVMMAASCSFATPISYQTNLMVYGPGGYHFVDYLRFGMPLSLLLWGLTIALTPLLWPF